MYGAGSRDVVEVGLFGGLAEELKCGNEMLEGLPDGGELEGVVVEEVEDPGVKHHVVEDHVVLVHARLKQETLGPECLVEVDVGFSGQEGQQFSGSVARTVFTWISCLSTG